MLIHSWCIVYHSFHPRAVSACRWQQAKGLKGSDASHECHATASAQEVGAVGFSDLNQDTATNRSSHLLLHIMCIKTLQSNNHKWGGTTLCPRNCRTWRGFGDHRSQTWNLWECGSIWIYIHHGTGTCTCTYMLFICIYIFIFICIYIQICVITWWDNWLFEWNRHVQCPLSEKPFLNASTVVLATLQFIQARGVPKLSNATWLYNTWGIRYDLSKLGFLKTMKNLSRFQDAVDRWFLHTFTS